MFLSDVKQEMLETIVPKGDSESIMVVLGEQRGQVSRAAVQVRCLLLTVFKAAVVRCSRWDVFSRGTRTNAERWFSSTDTRRKCSRWTMTPFVTTSEGQIVDYRHLNYCFVTLCFNSVQLSNKTLERLHGYRLHCSSAHHGRKVHLLANDATNKSYKNIFTSSF